MKRIILALLLAAALPARADVVAIAANPSGGSFMLTDLTCPTDRHGRIVMDTRTDGEVRRYGCATFLTDDLLLLSWSGGKPQRIPYSAFAQQKKHRKF